MRFSTFSSVGSAKSWAEVNGRIMAGRADAKAEILARRRATDANYDLHERIDRLTLVCQAMWELLGEHTGLSGDDLQARIEELDAADGRLDGSHRPPADRCACGAAVAAGSSRCQFCGAEAPDRSPFEAI